MRGEKILLITDQSQFYIFSPFCIVHVMIYLVKQKSTFLINSACCDCASAKVL